jgi:hypothetical protein
MPGPGFQIVNINYALAKKSLKPPVVCDISPYIALQVVNVEGLADREFVDSLHAITAWDMTNAISQATLREQAK